MSILKIVKVERKDASKPAHIIHDELIGKKIRYCDIEVGCPFIFEVLGDDGMSCRTIRTSSVVDIEPVSPLSIVIETRNTYYTLEEPNA